MRLDDTPDFLSGGEMTPQQQRYLSFANLPDSTMTKVGIPLGTLRQMIYKHESGDFGGYDALAWHPNYTPNATSLPTDANGFPQWGGSKATGKLSHGAGGAQIEPELWNEFAPGMGITNFSPANQDAVTNAIIMRYGVQPWNTNVNLARGIQQYKAQAQRESPIRRIDYQPGDPNQPQMWPGNSLQSQQTPGQNGLTPYGNLVDYAPAAVSNSMRPSATETPTILYNPAAGGYHILEPVGYDPFERGGGA